MSPRWAPDRLDREAYVSPGLDVPILFGDLDVNRHLNNVAYGRFFEHGRYSQHRDLGLPEILHRRGGGFLVARITIDYLRETHIGKPLHLRIRLREFGRTSMVEEQAAWQEDNCIALAEVIIAYRENGQPLPWPEEIRGKLSTLQVPRP
jgi:acyl-CoA thioester hydrolase